MPLDPIAINRRTEQAINAHTSPPLDVRHISCPPALFVLIPVMKSADNGEVIEILTTDSHDKEDIERWLRRIGGEVVNVVSEESYERIIIRKLKSN